MRGVSNKTMKKLDEIVSGQEEGVQDFLAELKEKIGKSRDIISEEYDKLRKLTSGLSDLAKEMDTAMDELESAIDSLSNQV